MTASNHSTPYWRLSGFYFFFFASIGAFVPYWSLYLEHLSYSPKQIGELMAVSLATKIIAPYVWGALADTSGQRAGIIRIAAFIGVAIFSLVLFVKGYWWLMVVLAGFSFFWNAMLPQFEATTLNHLGEDSHRYSRIRVWGSVGFILAASLLSPFFDIFGVEWLPWIVIAMLLGILLITLWIRDSNTQVIEADHPPMLKVLLQPHILALFAACFLLQASHGPYYTFFSIYVEQQGYSRSLVGQLWSLGVAAEVVVFMLMHKWLPKYGAQRLLLVSIGVTALRWFIIALWPDQLALLLAAQVMHAASFGLYHASAIHLIHVYFPGRLQGRGQALYSSISFGLGGSLGSLLSGYVWVGLGPSWVYLMASGMALVGFIIAWRGVRQVIEVY